MPWPLSQDYNEAIQSPAENFADADLRRGEAAANTLGLPVPHSGNFADVYQVRCPDGGRWAVKCFIREVPHLRERYAEIGRHLRQARLPFTVNFSYLERGLRVRGAWYPVLKMQWVEGLPLNQFVAGHLDRPATLEALLRIWARMGEYLRAAGLAHGDLQHGNVLLVPARQDAALALKLVDYDGLFVPSLAGQPPGEAGHPNYQHPQRFREGTYDAGGDRFSLLVVAAALRALTVGGRALWEKYDNGDNLLFREADLRAPGESALFRELLALPDAQARRLAGALREACAGPVEDVPTLEELSRPALPPVPVVAPEPVPVPASPESTRTPARRPTRRPRSLSPWLWAVAGIAAANLVVALLIVLSLGERRDEGGQAAVPPKKIEPPPAKDTPTPPTRDGGSVARKAEAIGEAPRLVPPPAPTPAVIVAEAIGEAPRLVVPPRPALVAETIREEPRVVMPPVVPVAVGGGSWQVERGVLVKVPGKEGWVTFGDPKWTDYKLLFRVERTAGSGPLSVAIRSPRAGVGYLVVLGDGDKPARVEYRPAEGPMQVPPLLPGSAGPKARAVLPLNQPMWVAVGAITNQCTCNFGTTPTGTPFLFRCHDVELPSGMVGFSADATTGLRISGIQVWDGQGRPLWEGPPKLAPGR